MKGVQMKKCQYSSLIKCYSSQISSWRAIATSDMTDMHFYVYIWCGSFI